MKTTIIIDGQGRVWDGDWSALRQKMRCLPTVSDLADFAVNKKGYVALRSNGLGRVEVWYRPSRAKTVALLIAVRLLEGYRKDRIVLMAHGVEAEPPFVGNFGNAVERLVGRASAAQDKRQQDFQARRRVVPDIAADADFGRIEYAWRAARGVMDQRLIEAMREASSGRHLEVAPQDGASKLVIGAVGEGYSLYGNGWKSVAIGGRFEDMPDYRYAQWASQAYREVFRTGQPVFEDVKAAVKLHRTGRLLLTYRRVILPIGGGERPTLLLGATLGQRVTRLGLEPSDELGDVFQ